MPIVDVFLPADLFAGEAGQQLAGLIAAICMTAEGYPPPAPLAIREITGVYLHRLPPSSVHTAADAAARTVRVQILTFPGALDDEAQLFVMSEITKVVSDLSGDPTQGGRTFVIVTEAMSGGWGVGGVRPTATTLGLT